MKVKWNENVCIHAGKCVEELPSIFKVVNDKSVIEEHNASEDKVKNIVVLFHSGALKIQN
tara:strand:- start:153 stop:332 length:180 start_codon:yes stop_codon:yes gene_type:complete